MTREVTARRNEGRNSVNVPVTSRGTMLAMSFCVCDVRRYGFTVGSVSQTLLFIFLSESFFRISARVVGGAPRIVSYGTIYSTVSRAVRADAGVIEKCTRLKLTVR